MNFWLRLLYRLGFLSDSQVIRFELDEPAQEMLRFMADQQNLTPEEMAEVLLRGALFDRQQAEAQLAAWQMITAREQEVAALTCLGYTNRQIAARLGVSPETVKSHLRSLLRKLGLHSKEELRQALDGLDFSAWE
ncbi:MAG: helix-turn-helix transcriptional regulator [Anaerolineaceae bacterium]|nr:helix-turn-helix transcriptional regulator [Anaerolineaceae bacterium]